MRDYRGKRKDTGEWVNGYLVLPNPEICRAFEINDAAIGSQHSFESGYLFHEVLLETVGQCTGIFGDFTDGKHKAGDLIKRSFIYEGDIVEPVLLDGTHQGFSWGKQVVVFARGAFCLKDRRGITTPMCNYAASVKFKVLGNIWDNPELMEVSE